MAPNEYSSTARSLALPVDDDDFDELQSRRANSPVWQRRSLSTSGTLQRPRTTKDRWVQSASRLQRKALGAFNQLTPLQKAALIAFNIGLAVVTILFLIYNERIFARLSPIAKSWRNLNGGWIILWLMTFFVSFPPMIGYSTCVTTAGFVYGMRGWFIVASATIIGSTAGFLASRSVLKNFVTRLTAQNKQFAALSLVLKHDGLKLLCMIRLCPLPYSLSNGAISTIPTVTWYNFALATTIVSPKLLLHVFIGSQIGRLAEDGSKMDLKTRAVSYISIAIGMVAGIATGWFIYAKTKARAEQLEAEEANNLDHGGRRASRGSAEYIDDPDEEARVGVLRRDDDISLHTGYDDAEEVDAYRDEFTDDEDARERDVFDDGDGDTDIEEEHKHKGER